MKREDLQKIEGLSKEQIDSIMGLHQTDVTNWQTRITGLQNDKTKIENDLKKYDGVNLEDLNNKISSLEQEKSTLETEKNDLISKHNGEIDKLILNGALDQKIYDSHTIDAVALKSHLDMSKITYDKDTKTLNGFDEQLETIQKERGYLFDGQSTGSSHGGFQGNKENVDLHSSLAERYK